MLKFLKQRPPLFEARIQHVVAENPDLAEAGERYCEQQMGRPKRFRGCIPLPGAKLKSPVGDVIQNPVDQAIIEKVSIPSLLKPIASVSAGVIIEDVTREEFPQAVDLPLICSRRGGGAYYRFGG